MREEMFLAFLVGWIYIYNYTKYQNRETFVALFNIKMDEKDKWIKELIFYISVGFYKYDYQHEYLKYRILKSEFRELFMN